MLEDPRADLKDLPDLPEIRVIRKQLGWTQYALARAIGLSQSFINKIERNEADPGYRTAKKDISSTAGRTR